MQSEFCMRGVLRQGYLVAWCSSVAGTPSCPQFLSEVDGEWFGRELDPWRSKLKDKTNVALCHVAITLTFLFSVLPSSAVLHLGEYTLVSLDADISTVESCYKTGLACPTLLWNAGCSRTAFPEWTSCLFNCSCLIWQLLTIVIIKILSIWANGQSCPTDSAKNNRCIVSLNIMIRGIPCCILYFPNYFFLQWFN